VGGFGGGPPKGLAPAAINNPGGLFAMPAPSGDNKLKELFRCQGALMAEIVQCLPNLKNLKKNLTQLKPAAVFVPAFP